MKPLQMNVIGYLAVLIMMNRLMMTEYDEDFCFIWHFHRLHSHRISTDNAICSMMFVFLL
jgi:hypothetical protein